MGPDEDLLQNYAVNEKILSSPATDSNSKETAWRQQSLMLQHLTRNSSSALQKAVLNEHQKKQTYQQKSDFLQQRASKLDALLGDFTSSSKKSPALSIDFDELNGVEELLEGACHGLFESCRHKEITAANLQWVQEKRIESNSTTSALAAAQPKQQQARPKAVSATARNTLSAYLQRLSPPPEAKKRLPQQQQLQLQHQSRSTNDDTEAFNCDFRTAREELMLQNMKKYGEVGARSSNSVSTPLFNYGSSKKSLGARRNVRSNFVPPVRGDSTSHPVSFTTGAAVAVRSPQTSLPSTPTCTPPDTIEPIDERLINIDPKMIELITNEIMHKYQSVDWSDIAGLDYAKSIIKEAVVYPLLRPDIFTGLRRPPRGILLFGPPGTGKTLIGKCIASKSQSTFFSISAASLTSKWIGDGEKMVRALFAVAAVHQPSVVFIDEIDSLLSQRSETEHESSRRLKTEFLVQLDGAATSNDDRILIVGATNRPQELDEAARRRLVRRLYIPLPELEARMQILTNLLQTVNNTLNSEEIQKVGHLTKGYSGADMESLCREASMEPIRSIPTDEIPFFSVDKVRPVCMQDFVAALQNVRPSVSNSDLEQYTKWNCIYGAGMPRGKTLSEVEKGKTLACASENITANEDNRQYNNVGELQNAIINALENLDAKK